MLSEGHTVTGDSQAELQGSAQTQKEGAWPKGEKKLSAHPRVQEETQGYAQQLVVQQAGRADTGEYSLEAGGRKVSLCVDITGVLTDSIWRR